MILLWRVGILIAYREPEHGLSFICSMALRALFSWTNFTIPKPLLVSLSLIWPKVANAEHNISVSIS